MLININEQNLELIKNKIFKTDAERYVANYTDFIRFIEDSGMNTEDAEEKRNLLVNSLIPNKKIIKRNNNSFSYGYISPACIDCRTGESSKTVFHTLACNRSCYFCANMNQEQYDNYSININNAEDELDTSMKGRKLSSVALTGGEPLLLPERALGFFRHVQDNYPDSHKRLYTNGDLLTDELAKKLAEAGLDEIRISVKADSDGYPAETLEKLTIARRYIPKVMVEMPVIPGTIEHMKDLLLKMEAIGCDGINLLEFLYPWTDPSEYKRLGFKVKRRPYRVLYSYEYAGGLPVAGSEEECLKLLEFAAEKGLKLGVHYCSLENKLTSQIHSQNAKTKLLPTEVLSDKDFFIKTVRAYGDNAKKVQKYLNKKNIDFVNGKDTVEFHPKYISQIPDLDELALTYNIVERSETFSHIREVKIDLIHPHLFDYKNDI